MAKSVGIEHDALAMIRYNNEPAVLVAVDSRTAEPRVRKLIEDCNARIRSVTSIEQALGALDAQLTPKLFFAAVEEDPGEPLDRLLERVDWETRAGRFLAIIAAPQALIDAVAARTLDSPIQHLCDPSDQDLIDAILTALSPTTARLNDVNRGGNGRLQQISEQVGRIASMLAELSEEEALDVLPSEVERQSISGATLRAIIRARRLRERYFAGELFADPAWDMMLDLMAARLEDRQVAVSSLCIAAAVPPTTALRWIKTLTEEGMFVRRADPQDGRRVYVELTDSAASSFEAYLRAVSRTGSLVI